MRTPRPSRVVRPALLVLLAMPGPARAAPAEAAQTVATTVAVRTPWQTHLDAVGNLRAVQGADLSPEVAGIVERIDFVSGEDVPAGKILLKLRLDDEPGRLAQLQAMQNLAEVNLARDSREFAAQAVSHASVDTDQANLASLRGQVAAEQALIDEKTVRAPFAGRLGIRAVDLGQYLQPGTAVVTLQSLDPIYADVNIPEDDLSGIRRGGPAELRVDGLPGRVFAARILAVTPKVDIASRTAMVRAQIANPDRVLLPGMFAHLRIDIGPPSDLLTLPQAALSFSTYGTTVFVIEHGTAHQRLVTTGPARGEQVAILSGLAPGQTVVTAGQIKLHDGTPVAINNAIEPGNSAHPSLPEE